MFARYCCISLILAALCAGQARAAGPSAIAQYIEAVMTADVPLLRNLLDEGFVYIDVDGRVMNKRTFLKSIEWGSIEVDRLHLEDVVARRYGTTTVATGSLYFVGRTDGMPISSPKQRFSIVAEEGSEKHVLLFQATPLRIKSTEPARQPSDMKVPPAPKKK